MAAYSKAMQLYQVKAEPKNMNKKKLRKLIAQRDGDWCLLCGRTPGDLQLHRIIYGAQGGVYELSNCVQLCPLCHNPKIHANKGLWQPRLLEYVRTQIKGWEVTE